jgi:hypothetical protein
MQLSFSAQLFLVLVLFVVSPTAPSSGRVWRQIPLFGDLATLVSRTFAKPTPKTLGAS